MLSYQTRKVFLAQTSGYSVSNSEGMVCSFESKEYEAPFLFLLFSEAQGESLW